MYYVHFFYIWTAIAVLIILGAVLDSKTLYGALMAIQLFSIIIHAYWIYDNAFIHL